MKLDALFAPKTLAVVGATESPGTLGRTLVENLLTGGFTGELILVNPNEPEVLGRRCLKDLRDHRGRVDLVLVTVPMVQLKAAVEQVLRCVVSFLAVLTSIERSVGSQEELIEQELARLCEARGVRLIGPNSLGVINLHGAMNASYLKNLPIPGLVSVVSQSSAICSAILGRTANRSLGLSKVVALGNRIDVDELDIYQALAEDDQTRVVIGYLENIRSGKEFVKVVEGLTAVKPVILLKAGNTRAGERAVAAHAGRTIISDVSYGAAFKRAGVIRADSFQALLDYARAFSQQPLPGGNRVAIVTNSGGPGILAADAVENAGMQMAVLAPATRAKLEALLPRSAGLDNPVDVLGDASPTRYASAVQVVLEDEGVDAVLLILTVLAETMPTETATAVIPCIRGQAKPVLAAFLGGREVMPGRRLLAEANIPDFAFPERAVDALGAMCEYATWRRRPPRVVTRFPVNRRRVERILRRNQRLGRVAVEEFMAKEILRAYDFAIPEGQLVGSPAEAVEVADRLGYPVVLKIVSPDIVHKTSLGGVRLNLTQPDQVRDGFDLIMMRIKREAPAAAIEGIYVEKMCPPGIEVVIGMNRDPIFGPMLMFGLGGIFVEVMEDVAFHLAPITAEEAMQMLQATRSYGLLLERAGERDVDVGPIAKALQRVSQLATDFPQIVELQIHPFIVGRAGTVPLAADVTLTIQRER